ncbi:hypothetical protein HOP50_20g86160 [Chloropicon primus]|nr:hypothetical protein HOP50_20g86160 [Chloropicon primus]
MGGVTRHGGGQRKATTTVEDTAFVQDAHRQNSLSRRRMLYRRRDAVATTLVVLQGVVTSDEARAAESVSSSPCSCPETAPCPADTRTFPFTTWSAVTGECLPWGPLGPAGVLASSGLFYQAATKKEQTFKDLDDVKTRRSREVEGGLRTLDAKAKQNVPYVWALGVLALSVPRALPLGLGLSFASAAFGLALGASQRQGE